MSKALINSHLYKKLRYTPPSLLMVGKDRICVDIESQSVQLTSASNGNSFTVFSKKNSMRYMPYTADMLMATVILNFGYHSPMHLYLHDKLHTMILPKE